MAPNWIAAFGPLAGSAAAQSFAAQAGMYGGHELRFNDNDKQKKWAGKAVPGAPAGNFVHELQEDLTKVGCYGSRVDGDYGGGTRDAVKRFQWCVSKGTHKSSTTSSLLKEIVRDGAVFVTGNCDHATARHLKSWVKDGFEVTGTLRVVAFSKFSEFLKAGDFDKLDSPSVGADDIVVHKDFVAALEAINTAASNAGVEFQVNQTMRIAGEPVGGAVVTPATNSQHLIGNAVDFNIKHAGALIHSSKMKWAELAQAPKNFITAVKANDLRWGGDWEKRDPIHFDAYIDSDGPDFKILYYLNQRSIQRKQPLLRVT